MKGDTSIPVHLRKMDEYRYQQEQVHNSTQSITGYYMPRTYKALEKTAKKTASMHVPPPRPVTDSEWEDYSQSFPKLKRENAYITDPGTYDGYNCIGWSIGDNALEYDVEPVAAMVQFYINSGFRELPKGSAEATVDLMAVSDGYMASHATHKYVGDRCPGMPPDLWESKLYPGMRMTHGRYELQGVAYGCVVKSFQKNA